MSFPQFLTYVTHHSESIIQWLFFTIIALTSIIVGKQIFFKRSAGDEDMTSSNAPMPGEIQSVLQKILDQTNKLENVSLETLKAGENVSEDVMVQLDLLKKDLQTREEEISRLQKAGGGGGGSGISDAQAKEYSVRIKELEAKLEEYSILEDDIADLSLYKEENAKLKSELEKLHASGGSNAAPVAAAAPPAAEPAVAKPTVEASVPVSEPAPTETKSAEDDLVAEFAEAMNQPIPESILAEPVELKTSEDPMADFEEAVKLEKEIAPEAAAAAPEVTAAPAAKSKDADDTGSTDLFGEFAEGKQDDEFGELDTDKMMEEMAAMVMSEAADGKSALEENVDTDKMLEEADNLTKSS